MKGKVTEQSKQQQMFLKKSDEELQQTIINKFRYQWKTLKKAFIDLNKEKTGSIMPQELKKYLKHWGI